MEFFSRCNFLNQLLLIIFFFNLNQALAGELIVQNNSMKNIICHIDGYVNPIQISPHTNFSISQTKENSSINWVECNGLKQRNIRITSTSSKHWFIFNGNAKNVLNVLLYPYIPTYPENDFSAMTKRMTEEFQALHPEVLVNIVISTDPTLDTYTFANLPNVLGSQGFDLVEIDTMLLGEVVRKGLATTVETNPNIFLPATYQAITYDNLTYGVPSRVCAYYLFSHDPAIKSGFQSLDSLVSYLNKFPKDEIPLISDFNGSWNLPSFYLQSYASNHGSSNLDQVLNGDIDQASIDSFTSLANECNSEDNKCVNRYYHKDHDAMEKDFDNDRAYNYLGYSEAAFYIQKNSSSNIYASLISYGSNFYPLVYTDAYVKNATTCNDQTCNINFKNFTNYMNMVSTQLWINFSEDLEGNLPPRYLLSANKHFYDEPRVKNNSLYSNFIKNLAGAVAYPNNGTEEEYLKVNQNICAILAIKMPNYRCK